MSGLSRSTVSLILLVLAVSANTGEGSRKNVEARLGVEGVHRPGYLSAHGGVLRGSLQLDQQPGQEPDDKPPLLWPKQDEDGTGMQKELSVPARFFPWLNVEYKPTLILRLIFGLSIICCGLAMWCCVLPSRFYTEYNNFKEQKIADRRFQDYMAYHFNYWMASKGIKAHGTLLAAGCLTLATFGAITYSLLTKRSPVEGLWMVFVWASASSVAPDASTTTCIVGVFTTLGGLLLLALLLSTITDYFNSNVEASKEGRDPIVEGNHMVVIGYSTDTRSLLEELGLAEEERMTVALLAEPPKAQTEAAISKANTNLDGLKLVVRSGMGSAWQDLRHVAADAARGIVIAEDPKLSREESDAATFGALLTLKGKDWPISENSYITVQCALSRNEQLMKSLHPEKTLVVNGEKLGRLMVQSSCDPGLCQVFSQIIGFDGDEFYCCSAEELGIDGETFCDIAFRFPTAIPLGILDTNGVFFINPEKSRRTEADDQVIVLAEDSTSFDTIKTPFFDYQAWMGSHSTAEFREIGNEDEFEKTKTLICNYNDRGIGSSIIAALDEMMGPGSQVDIYTGMPEEECMSSLENAQRRQGRSLQNITFKIHHADGSSMASIHNLETLPLETYDHIFVLRDDQERPDQKTVAEIVQMQAILQSKLSDSEEKFNPVVQVGNKTTGDQLLQCGITNSVNTNLIMSRALAMVAMNKISHGVLTDLLSADGNNFDIQQLRSYIRDDETLPAELSFAEATAYVSRAAQQVLIGWSEGFGTSRQWLINPKEKLQTREWNPEDRLVVIKDV